MPTTAKGYRDPATSGLLTLASLVTAVVALRVARDILLPITLAILLSFLLTPLANRIERWGIHRVLSVIAVVGLAFGVLASLGGIVTSQAFDLSKSLPRYKDQFLDKVHAVAETSAGLGGVATALEKMQKELILDSPKPSEPAEASRPTDSRGGALVLAPVTNEDGAQARREDDAAVAVKVVSMPPSPLAQVRGWLGPLVAPLTTAGIVVVLVIFLLLQREDQRNRLLRLFGAHNLFASTEAIADISHRVSRYLRLQFLVNAGYGTCVGVGLAILGVPGAVMWGVLSFSLRFLPYLGPWLSAAMPIAVSLAVTAGWSQPVMVVSWFVILELVVNNFVEPFLYGSTVGVSGVGVIMAAIIWAWLWGPIGLVLAMPLTVCLVVLARYVPQLRFVTVLLGDQPTLTLDERIYQRLLALDDREASRLAADSLKETTLVGLFDDVLIPALRLAERDRRAGLLSDDQDEFVEEAVRDLVEELGVVADVDGDRETELEEPTVPERRKRVLCVSLRNSSDEIVAMMLGRLLANEGIDCEIAPPEAPTSDLLEQVGSADLDAVVVSIVPPLPTRTNRLLCRRLRARRHDLPMIIGLWSGAPSDTPRPSGEWKADGEGLTTLSAAVERINSLAPRSQSAAGREASARDAVIVA